MEKINISEIHPAEYNPRIMPKTEYEKLKNSLDTFGLVDPIIVDLKHDNTIIGGHQRYTVLHDDDPNQILNIIKLGDIGLIIKEKNIKINDINDQKALNIALNKITGEWDYIKLDNILNELQTDHYKIELTGFEPTITTDLDSITLHETPTVINNEHHHKENTTPDTQTNTIHNTNNKPNTPDHKPITTTIQQGDIFKLGNHRLMCGDATIKTNVEKLTQNDTIDICFMSPPYNTQQGRKTQHDMDDTYYDNPDISPYADLEDNLTNDEYTKLLTCSVKNALDHCDDVLLNIGLTQGDKIGLINLLHTFKKQFGEIIVWDKLRCFRLGFPSQKHNISHQAEFIFTFNHDGGRQFKHSQWEPGQMTNIIATPGASTDKQDDNWGYHHASFPASLVTEILTNYCDTTVLDLFGGTGTTLLTAETLHKKSYLMELSPIYCQLIINRYEKLTGKKAEKIN